MEQVRKIKDIAMNVEDHGLGEMYPFESHYFTQKDFIQHYVDEGPRNADVIVMMHGNPTWSFYYRNLVKHYSKKYRVIVPDHMGCGFSSKPQDGNYTLKNHIDHIEELLNHLGVKSFHLVVHDWGGAIGFGLATRKPESVKSAIIFNTAAFNSPHIPKRIALCRAPFIGEFLVRGLNGFAWPATFMTTVKKLTKEQKKGYLLPYNNYKNRVAVYNFVKDIPMEKNHQTRSVMQEIEDKLTSVECPKMMVWGGKDFCFNDHFYNDWQKFYPGIEKHYFENAGHYVIEDETEKVLDLMDQFYGRVQ